MENYKKYYNNICTVSQESWLNKLNLEYALYRILNKEEFVLIRTKGIFKNKDFLEELQKQYNIWIDVFNKQILKFNINDKEFIVIIDKLEDTEFCLFVKYNSIIEIENYNILYFILLNEIERIKKIEDKLPVWYRELLWKNIHKKSPILVLSEIGSNEKKFIESFINIKLGTEEKIIFFESLDLSEKVQLFEFYGYDPGERFKQGNTIPIFQMDLNALIIVEVSNLAINIQKKIVNELEKVSSFFSNVFCIFTSNYDIGKMVEFNKFDSSLWNILKEKVIILPPLRKVKENLFNEIDRFLKMLTIKYRKKTEITKSALNKIMEYDWHGNLEEFYQTLETAFILAKEGIITEKDLLFGLWKDYEKKDLNLRRNIENLEKSFILNAYRLTGGNQVHMANILGISRGSLQYKLQKYGIRIEDE
ncbi:MAG: hypothetical protein KatS3mg129_2267 [Leptospiraceae bacterium]|nr:MAG: hypothetical protein KatS3mg129_2267 [Leptospiraceae bacterium]